MTTIACNLSEMSSDSFLTGDGTTCRVTKIFKTPAGLLGVAGTFSECMHFVEWFVNEGDPDDAPEMEDVIALYLTKEGIHIFDGSIRPYKVDDSFCAVGSGAQAALAVMALGGQPTDAVYAASKVDPYTGGHINRLKLPTN